MPNEKFWGSETAVLRFGELWDGEVLFAVNGWEVLTGSNWIDGPAEAEKPLQQ